ncbi:MAG: pilus assembly PilX N-terminal domain-containing protein [Thermoanaerobaculia bacterium]|nr:pilus assembly PilX N-terminal domain-containing protein [Thermoanaerobaculia bacterium]
METLRKLASQIETRERGSALLVALMVIVGLSLLGLSFVAMSETEGAISLNQRNYSQAQTVSEAGAKLVADWFNNPEQIAALGLMPPVASETTLKMERWIDTNGDGTDENRGRWKVSQPYFCCDKPFRGATLGDRLWGTYFSPDVLIDESTNAGQTFLTAFNTALFPNPTSGEVTEIRIYAPPIVGAVNTPNDINGSVAAGRGYYDSSPSGGNAGVRYGLATIAVKATVKRLPGQLLTATGNRVLSERTTRVVISEWPFPGPQGPVQSNANIQTGGSVVVHWGRMTAQGTMYIKRDLQGLPWMDAHTRIPFWYGGYDTSLPWTANTQYQRWDIVRPSNAATAADHHYIADSVVGAGATSGVEPAWPVGAGATISDGQVTWKERSPARFNVDPGSGAADFPRRPWLFDIINLPFEDPWVEARARGAFQNPGTPAGPQPYPWTWGGGTPQAATDEPNPKLSNWFQGQNKTDPAPSLYKEVVFPRINYTFWKDLALAGQGDDAVKYLRWVSADLFSDGQQTKSFKQWTNTGAGTPPAKPGFYFFDTKNGQNPQVPGGAAFLTPAVNISSAGGNIWTMSGFIYLNAVEFGTQGVNGVDGDFNFPGEPYLDQGYRAIDPATGRLKRDPITGALSLPDATKAGNRYWDYQDYNGNGKFDLYLTQRSIKRNTGAVVNNVWMPVQFFDGCTILNATNTCPGGQECCSEPHEPYINLRYPLNACCVGGSYPNTLTVGWEAPNSQTKRPKKKLLPDKTVMPNCNGADADVWDAMIPPRSLMYCSSNLYDRDGEFDTWSGVQEAPVLNGVFYNEGNLNSQGNARYFGSLLINGSVDNSGTPEVWFDERLIKDEWPPAEWPFPRVFITSTKTDDL